MKTEIPSHPIEEVAEDFSDLHTKLLTGKKLPDLPFMLIVGDSGFRITEENRDTLALGMLLCLTVRGHVGS